MTLNEKFGTQVTKIAPRMGMEPNSLSRLLKSLEEKELVFKRKDDEDKRKVYICLTKSGLKLRNIAADRLFSLEKSIKDKILFNTYLLHIHVLRSTSGLAYETRS